MSISLALANITQLLHDYDGRSPGLPPSPDDIARIKRMAFFLSDNIIQFTSWFKKNTGYAPGTLPRHAIPVVMKWLEAIDEEISEALRFKMSEEVRTKWIDKSPKQVKYDVRLYSGGRTSMISKLTATECDIILSGQLPTPPNEPDDTPEDTTSQPRIIFAVGRGIEYTYLSDEICSATAAVTRTVVTASIFDVPEKPAPTLQLQVENALVALKNLSRPNFVLAGDFPVQYRRRRCETPVALLPAVASRPMAKPAPVNHYDLNAFWQYIGQMYDCVVHNQVRGYQHGHEWLKAHYPEYTGTGDMTETVAWLKAQSSEWFAAMLATLHTELTAKLRRMAIQAILRLEGELNAKYERGIGFYSLNWRRACGVYSILTDPRNDQPMLAAYEQRLRQAMLAQNATPMPRWDVDVATAKPSGPKSDKARKAAQAFGDEAPRRLAA